jgi:transcriptional regulator with XRE-family HTH domain
MKQKIETGAQARAAIREIQRKTRWSLLRTAKESGIERETLRKVQLGMTVNPGLTVRNNLAILLNRVKLMEGVK